jgi:lipoprotein NlpI
MISRIVRVLRGLVLGAALLASACRRDTVDTKNCTQQPNGDAVLESCSRAIASGRLSSSKLATALYNRGIAYQDRGDFDRAIADFDRVVELRPDTSKAFYNRAISYLRKGEFERAIKDFDRVVQLTPDYAPGFMNRGNAYRSLLAFDRAIQDYDQAIRLAPEYAVAFSNRGVAYMNKELYDRAIEDLDKVVRSKPDDGRSYRDRGSALYDKGEFKRAVQDLVKATDLQRDDPYAAIRRFLAESRVGMDATARLRDGASGIDLQTWPGPVISMYLGDGSPDQVLEAAKQAPAHAQAQREHLSEAYYYIGHGLMVRGQRAKAIEMFRAAVAAGPTSAIEYAGAHAELERLGR